MAFDENKYKAIFEQRYGKGSFDAGLQQARTVGRLKAEASQAKTNYTAAKKDYTASLKVKKKKTYADALSYFSDPSVKEAIKNDGAYKVANEIKNDPQKQADIKAQGYSVSDYIDAMYNAASEESFVRNENWSVSKELKRYGI
jgi:hypothetical protein